MSKIEISSLISSLTLVGGPTWRQVDYDASKMVKFIKGEDINGYFTIMRNNVQQTFTTTDRESFLAILLPIIASRIAAFHQELFSIVPIPNSGAILGHSGDYRTLSLATKIAQLIGARASACDAFRWKRKALSSRRGGTRDPQQLYDNLTLITLPTTPVVLFDDVMTTGAHVIACTRKLSDHGLAPEKGVAIARATWDQKPNIAAWIEEFVDVSPQNSDLTF